MVDEGLASDLLDGFVEVCDFFVGRVYLVELGAGGCDGGFVCFPHILE